MWRNTGAIDISEIVAYRKSLGPASLAAAFYAFISAGASAPYFLKADYIAGLYFLCTGAAAFFLSFQLRKGSRAAASLLAAVFVSGMILVVREAVIRMHRMRWSEQLVKATIALLLLGPVTYFLTRGIVAVFEFGRGHLAESLESLNTLSSYGDYRAGRYGAVVDEGDALRMMLFQRVSEAALLAGACLLLVDAALHALNRGGVALLSAFGLIGLILGVNLSLRAQHLAANKARAFLKRDSRSAALLIRSAGDEMLKVRSRISLRRSLTEYFSRISFMQIIGDNLSPHSPVMTIGGPADSSLPGEAQYLIGDELISPREIGRKRIDISILLMVIGRIEGPARNIGLIAQSNQPCHVVLVFPPVNDSDMRARWGSFRGQVGEALVLPPLSDSELKRAVLLVFRENYDPLLITASARDEWTYEVAFGLAVQIVMCPVCAAPTRGQF